MVDQKYITLMHKEMDLEISAAEKTRLSDYLSNNPEAEEVYQQLLLVKNNLSNVKEIDPPSGLKSGILNEIDRSLYNADNKKETSIIVGRPFFQRRRVQTAFAIAAGIIIGLVLYPLIGYAPQDQNWGTINEITGTIGPHDSIQGQKTQSKKIVVNELQGSIDIRQTRKTILVVFNLSGRDKFDIQLNYDPNILTFFSLQPQSASDIILHHNKNDILITATHAFVLLFSRNSTDHCELNISLLFDREAVHRTTFIIN